MSHLIRAIVFECFIRPFVILFIGIRVYGREHLRSQKPMIIVANHSSHLDTAVLMSLLPLKDLKIVRPVAASDYFECNRIRGFIFRLFFNILAIERKHISRDHNPLEPLRKAIGKGESLIIFPEGTRSSSGEIGVFRSGIAHLIKEFPQVPIIPVYLSNMARAMPKGEFIIVPFLCQVHFAEPMHPKGSKEEIMQTLRATILQLKERAQ